MNLWFGIIEMFSQLFFVCGLSVVGGEASVILVKIEAHRRQNKHAQERTRYVLIFTIKTVHL